MKESKSGPGPCRSDLGLTVDICMLLLLLPSKTL
jgi:hypothetical protein